MFGVQGISTRGLGEGEWERKVENRLMPILRMSHGGFALSDRFSARWGLTPETVVESNKSGEDMVD